MEPIDYTKDRAKQFMASTKREKEDLLKRREKYNLELRKDKQHEFLMNKRWSSINNTAIQEDCQKFEILPSDLNLSNDFQEVFLNSPNMLEQALRMICEDKEDIRKFGLRQVRNYTMVLDKNTSPSNWKLSPANYDDMMNLLMNTNDLKEIFEISWIMINLSHFSSEFTVYIAKPHFISDLFKKLINIEDYTLKNNILWILANMLGESENMHRDVVDNSGIVKYTSDLIGSSNIPSFFYLSVIWTVGNLFKYADVFIIDSFVDKISDILKLLRSNLNEDLFGEALFTTSKIAQLSDVERIVEIFKTSGVHKYLVNYIKPDFEKSQLKMIFTIIGNLYYADNFFINETYERKIHKAFEKYLEFAVAEKGFLAKNKENIKEVIWCLYNFITIDNEKIRGNVLRHTKIPKLLLQIAETTTNQTIIERIGTFFINALDTTDNKNKTELLRNRILEFFNQFHNKLNQSKEITEICLQGFFSLLVYGETIMKDRNIVKEELLAQGTNLTIDQMQNNPDENISELATEIMTKFFLGQGVTYDDGTLFSN
jgi:hypothetical protein